MNKTTIKDVRIKNREIFELQGCLVSQLEVIIKDQLLSPLSKEYGRTFEVNHLSSK